MNTVVGAGGTSWRATVQSWVVQLAPAYLAHLIGVVAVTAAIAGRSIPWLVLAAAYLAVATIVLEARLTRQRAQQGQAAVVVRAAVGAVQLAVGMVLLLWRPGEAWTFVGLTSLLLFLSTARAEYRSADVGKHVRGPLLLGLAVLLVGLGLWPIGAIDAMAGVALVGFGLLAGVAGIEVGTEDWIRGRSTWTTAAMHRRALQVLVVGGAAWFLVVGLEPAYLGVLLVVFGLVLAAVVAASADSDSAEIVVLLAVALVWAAAPRDVGAIAALEPRPGEPWFVALGDSYISGEGAKRYFDGTNDRRDNECRRAPTAHPVQLALRGGPAVPDRLLFLACSGALAVDLHHDRPGRTEPVSQLDQLAAAIDDLGLDPADLELVLLSIGGNDAGFGEIGRACVLPGDCTEIGARWLDRLEQVRAELDGAFTAVRHAVDARVLVVPYPMPLAERGCWWSSLTAREARFVTGFVRQLNTVVTSAAVDHGFEVIETMEPSLGDAGLRVCDPGWPWDAGMNFIGLNPTSGDLPDLVNPRHWIHNSLHPNAAGHEAMFRTVEAWLTDPDPGALADLEPAPVPDALACDVDDPPVPCGQRTAEWQGAQLLAHLRAAAVPVALMVLAAWLLVAPVMRVRAERRASSLGRRILELVEALHGRLRARVGGG